MATGPQRYPGASTAYWYQGKYGGNAMESNVIVWHSTEGTSLPSYSGGAEAPNFTAKPNFAAKKLEWYQHFDFDTSARALVNLAGGVETNTLNVCQVEIVGTCDPATHTKWTKAGYAHLYTPELPDWVIRDLADFAKWAHDQHGVPLTSTVTFKAYPGSYGSGNGVRMSFAQWNGFRGHCGHQHVPENLHGDPGAFPIATILTAAKGANEPAAPAAPSTPSKPAPSKPSYEPYPGEAFFMKGSKPALGKRSPIFNAMGQRLVAVGCSRYKVGPGLELGQADVDSYEAWQRMYNATHRKGWTGSALKWPPGKETWNALKVPKS
ncbi:peptidoglycan-binding protein [Streptomyces sp. NPDC056817]|uniref:peptidoglycan-binding protein n=1 Tax=Streptomyces sp. NPDC056817 TaxID=3345950 RepID=UPI0036C6F032